MALLNNQINAKNHLEKWKVGALFMEPGSGKTRVAVDIVNSSPCDSVFWIGPLRTINTSYNIETIKDEIAKWGGFNKPSYYFGIESIQNSDRIYFDLYDKILSYKNPFVVIDESLKIKNAESKRTKMMIEIGKHVEYKLILNGTPISRNLLDVWSQMEFISPLILGMSLSQFKYNFCKTTTITKKIGFNKRTYEFISGYENVDCLYSLIRHYVFECDLNLNISKRYNSVYYTLSDDEKENYQNIKSQYLDLEYLDWNRNIFMEMTQKLQHSYCCAEDKFEKLSELFKLIPEEEAIIFCKYIRSTEECKRRFPKSTVLSYQKESYGLNMQHIHHTVFFDKIWNYADRMQSGRRTYRTGQLMDCYYYDFTGNVGLEDVIDNNISKKEDMIEYFKKISITTLKNLL